MPADLDPDEHALGGAAYGAVVAVFQFGIGADIFGFTQVDTITNWLPVMLFCILFGLSMDYHVFLLSRVREHFDHTGDNDEAVRVGLQQTGRLITGAALIMVAVFGSFAGGRLVEMQQMGFGLAFAVLIDATLIRTILVPAMLKLCGKANWYLPRGLRWLPDVRVEGDPAPPPIPTAAQAGRLGTSPAARCPAAPPASSPADPLDQRLPPPGDDDVAGRGRTSLPDSGKRTPVRPGCNRLVWRPIAFWSEGIP